MTRKHFERIARMFRETKPHCVNLSYDEYTDGKQAGKEYMWEDLVEEFALLASEFNSSFDRDRFYAACEYNK